MTTLVRCRPIIFSGESVRAIIDGRKRQTRRVVKRDKAPECNTLIRRPEAFGTGTEFFMDMANPMGPILRCNCPYGKLGDRLWVRERWDICQLIRDPTGEAVSRSIDWNATDDMIRWDGVRSKRWHIAYAADGDDAHEGPWRSPRFMPRWASRLTLEIVSVRVERLQAISEADAIAERFCRQVPKEHDHGSWLNDSQPIDAFARTWDALNAKRGHSWAANPWVWVIEFRKI